MSAATAFGLGLASVTGLLVGVWLIQLVTRNAGLVDVVWSAALGLIGLEYALAGTAPAPIRLLMAVLALSWSLRLALYLARRMRGAAEDSRYAAARRAWGRRADLYLLLFFLAQALIAAVLSLPWLVLAYRDHTPSAPALALGVAIWFVSLLGEAVADAQLAAFKAEPANRGKVCRTGLWRYSRHPNYFFECTHWLAYAILAAGAAYGWLALVGPVLMAVLLLKVSGIPTLEGGAASERREGHEEYVRTTSAFVPWPPKRAR